MVRHKSSGFVQLKIDGSKWDQKQEPQNLQMAVPIFTGRIQWINKLLFGSIMTITNIKIDYFTQRTSGWTKIKFLAITEADNYFMADNW